MALVTTVLFNNYLKQLDKKYKKNENKISILVAKQFIGKNEKITKDMLQLKEFSSDSVQPEAIKKIEDVEGKYALVDIQEGEALLPFRFTNQFEEEQVITRKIRDGYRAVSVEVNLVESVSNLVQPEDYVDVVFSENTGAEGVRKIVDTQPILENVRVLAVGKRLKEQGSDNKTIKADTKTSNDQNRNEQCFWLIRAALSAPGPSKPPSGRDRNQLRGLDPILTAPWIHNNRAGHQPPAASGSTFLPELCMCALESGSRGKFPRILSFRSCCFPWNTRESNLWIPSPGGKLVGPGRQEHGYRFRFL
jgi:pilus assembly protein CpaB